MANAFTPPKTRDEILAMAPPKLVENMERIHKACAKLADIYLSVRDLHDGANRPQFYVLVAFTEAVELTEAQIECLLHGNTSLPNVGFAYGLGVQPQDPHVFKVFSREPPR